MQSVPDIKLPENFEPPGPATQAETMLEVIEWWLNDYIDDYNEFTSYEPDAEGWVKFRELYANIHWMYQQLVGKEGPEEEN